MVKRAILIGSTYHDSGEKSELEGVFTDIISRRNNLIDSFGYKSDDIIILTDQYMTYSPEWFKDYTEDYETITIENSKVMYSSKINILYIIKKLINMSKPNDELFVQFAGHGIQLPFNRWNKETDFKDEAYLALNNRGKIEKITDNELSILFNPTPCKTLIIFDNCHSATIMDAPNVIYYDIYKKKFVLKEENNNYNFNKNIIVISGSRDDDYSYDGPNKLSLQRTGIFTLSLIESQRKILETEDKINLDELLKESTKWLFRFHKRTSKQLPHISGNFKSIEEIENYTVYSKNDENIKARQIAQKNSDIVEIDTKKILISVINKLLKEYLN
jgi:hypothetical protein